MTNRVLIYRPPSKLPVIGAFAAAIAIHLCAVALASHRMPPEIDLPPFVELNGFEPPEPIPAPPDLDSLSLPAPSDSPEAEFVEPKPTPSLKQNPAPARFIRPARSSEATYSRSLALQAPRPDYPYEARRRDITGTGVAILTVDETNGQVVHAEMEQSIGNSILDEAALRAFRRWRFRTGTPPRVRVPITFTLTGAQL